MTVAELLDQLATLPAHLRVVVDGYEGGFDDPHVLTVMAATFAGVDGDLIGRHRDAQFHHDQEAKVEACICISRHEAYD